MPLTQINSCAASRFSDFHGSKRRRDAMFDSEALRDELKSLSRVLNANGEEMLNQSKARAEALADQIKTARNELGEALGQEESHVEKMVAERPIASLASAFALGVVVGFLASRH